MKVLEWVLAVLLAFVLGFAAVRRFFDGDFRSAMADALNVPGWFLVVVSVLELVLAVDLVWPRFRILGAIGSMVVMIGAAVFNLAGESVDGYDPGPGVPVTIVLAVIGLVVAWLAAGRPADAATLFATARRQAAGQMGAVADAATDLVD